MEKKHSLENEICRAAIAWERAHAEYEKPQTISPKVEEADKALEKAARMYTGFLIEEGLPLRDDEETDD